MRSVGTRFLLPFGLLAVLISVFVLYRAHAASQKQAERLVNQQATLAMKFNLAIRDYAARKIRPTMESLVGKDDFIPETMSTSFISRSIFEAVQKDFPGYIIRFASDNPRNPVNKASPDDLRMIEYFRKNPQAGERTQESEINGQRYLVHLTPKWITAECLHCHGDPKDAPAALLKKYGDKASFYRKIGDVAGLDTVAIPIDMLMRPWPPRPGSSHWP